MQVPCSDPDRQVGDGARPTAVRTDEVRLSAIDKIRLIMEALPGAEDVVGISELARHVHLSKSSVSRICAELVEWGVVARVGQGVRLGPRLGELGANAPLSHRHTLSRRALCDLARPYLVDLYADLRVPVGLSIIAGLDSLVIDRIAGVRTTVRHPVYVGGRGPAHLTAAGRAILAYDSASNLDRILRRPLERRTRYSVGTAPMLNDVLAEVRRRGSAVVHEEFRLGTSSIAVPVRSSSGWAIAAISVGSQDKGSLSALERKLQQYGELVSEALRRDEALDERRHA